LIRLLLISDLDGTWLPTPGRESDLARLEAAVASAPQIHLAFATGRTLPAALEALGAVGSSGPRTLVTDVGCVLHRPDGDGGWTEDPAYREAVVARWDEAAAARVLGHLPEGIRDQPGVSARHRLALQVDPGFNPVERAAPLRKVLEAEGLTARIMPSHGFYIDVLPTGVDKGFAVRFLREELRNCHVISCGDSENDLDLFRAADTALLMPQHHLEDGHLDELAPTLIRCTEPGPAGILAELERLGHL
jgi:sucrose-phosphate synthase